MMGWQTRATVALCFAVVLESGEGFRSGLRQLNALAVRDDQPSGASETDFVARCHLSRDFRSSFSNVAAPKKIVFVCGGNTGRSISAQTLAKAFAAKKNWEATFDFTLSGAATPNSATMPTLHPANTEEEVLEVPKLLPYKVALKAHRSHALTLDEAKGAWVVLTAVCKHKKKLRDMWLTPANAAEGA